MKVTVDPALTKDVMKNKATATATSAKFDAKLFRNACQQNLVVTVALLSHEPFYRQACIMIYNAKPHSRMARHGCLEQQVLRVFARVASRAAAGTFPRAPEGDLEDFV